MAKGMAHGGAFVFCLAVGEVEFGTALLGVAKKWWFQLPTFRYHWRPPKQARNWLHLSFLNGLAQQWLRDEVSLSCEALNCMIGLRLGRAMTRLQHR
jgi:hypothetical protein